VRVGYPQADCASDYGDRKLELSPFFGQPGKEEVVLCGHCHDFFSRAVYDLLKTTGPS
jgi:hypothetical protein